jgi:hypothetical protein
MFGGAMVGLQYATFLQQLGEKLDRVVNYHLYVPAPTMNFPGIEDFLKIYQARAARLTSPEQMHGRDRNQPVRNDKRYRYRECQQNESDNFPSRQQTLRCALPHIDANECPLFPPGLGKLA